MTIQPDSRPRRVEWNAYSSVWLPATVLKRGPFTMKIRLDQDGEVLTVDTERMRSIAQAPATP